jgi:tetratricopeptide (TPR) repeat protein
MPEPVALKYRAFLSYAHADSNWGTWLHRQLERFPIAKDLAGRETAMGPVPKSLRPIFRDREDFAGGHTLGEATIAALDQSAALIVLCSPVAATRPAVNEEVRLFRSRHVDRPVIPVIIEGKAPANFPPALSYEIAADGTITDRPKTILGPDLREDGDGRSLGLSKVVAGLTGVGTDEIVRRAERDQRRRLRNWVAGLSVVIIALAGLAAWAEFNRREAERNFLAAKSAADRIVMSLATKLRNTQGVPLAISKSILDEATKVYDTLAQSSGSDRSEVLVSRSYLLHELIDTYAALGDLPARGRAVGDYLKAMAELTRRDPTNADWQLHLSFAHRKAGDLHITKGDLNQALQHHKTSLAIRERLLAAAPENPTYLHEVGVSHSSVGLVELNSGDAAAALRSFRAAHELLVKAADANPRRSDWVHDVGISLSQRGDAYRAFDNPSEALASYQAALPVMERLMKAEPQNWQWPFVASRVESKISEV